MQCQPGGVAAEHKHAASLAGCSGAQRGHEEYREPRSSQCRNGRACERCEPDVGHLDDMRHRIPAGVGRINVSLDIPAKEMYV